VDDIIDFDKAYKLDDDDTAFEFVEGFPVSVFSLLDKKKKDLFNIDKPIREIKADDLLENAIKVLPNITLDDYRAFLLSIEEYKDKTSLRYTDDIEGFSNYLYTMIEEAGYYDLACILQDKRHPEKTRGQKMNFLSMFALTAFNICQRNATKAYQPPTYRHLPVGLYQQPNDKITKNLATATREELEQGHLIVNEKVNNILSYITLYPEETKALGLDHITIFDMFVLFNCISIKAAGNKQTTINIIYKTMTGKDGEVRLTEKMRQELIQSIDKLRLTPITIDATGICAKYHHKTKGKYVKNYLLPAKMAGEGFVNGGLSEDIIVFLDDSPLYEIAMMKNKQIFSINRDVFDVPKVKANKQNLVVRQVLVTLVYDACHSPKVENTVLIDTLMERCGWTGTRARLVEVVEKCLAYWVEKKYLITSYKIKKGQRGKTEKVSFSPLKEMI
jgi:hypothetical protein